MKHLLKKLSIAGAGGKGSKPKPPIYKPPVMGELQYGASHSYAETLDLLSDGPIEGIVNSNGELVDGLNILQGIYLDDTPVAVTNQPAKKTSEVTSLEQLTFDSLNIELNAPPAVD
jgi:predicted phage tail protein